MQRKLPRRIMTVVLSLAMLLTLLPVAAFAADGDTSTSGIELSKTATLEDDGTYTIDLEAYATGETTTTTVTSSTPLDIVLVIDQSGSMAQNDSGSNTNTESDRRYYKLKAAVESFVKTIAANAKSTGADHRIAIAGYGTDGRTGTTSVTGAYKSPNSNTSYWVNTGLFVDGTLKNYGGDSYSTYNTVQLTTTDYQKALVSAYDENTDAVTASITTAISNFAAYGGTYTEYGLLMAQNVFANNSASYTYTDDNGETQTGTRKRIVVLFTDGETNSDVSDVLTASNTLKSTYNATVYCVGFGSTVNSDFLSYVSSNYGSDTSYTSGYRGGYSGTSNGTTKYSMTATNSSELNNIFQTITEDVSSDSTTVTLDANSVMKDIMADGFTLTSNSTVSIKTVAGSVVDGEIVWGDETDNEATASVSGNTVSVTGFNYAEKYISSGHTGEKICVTIKGVLPTTDVTTDEAVNTNAATSGIYATADATEATATFPQPQTIITKKLYVLDYAKTAELTGLDQDSSVTGIVDTFKAVSSSNSSLNQSYGASALSNNTLTYTPTTMSWDGYDSLYVFGKTTNSTVTALQANSNGNLWSKVSVIPANNVYYEDDFITTSTDKTTATGTVGIVYSGGNWSEVGTSAGNTETVNGPTYGWETSLNDDATYSDGTAHASGTAGATATFTFTGTGVDIYSRTDMNTGNVKVTLKGTSEENTTSKVYICDNESVSGTYYQIPTVSFENLTYDTYTVTIKVATNDSSNYTYYLDGVRVYNPLGTVTEDDGDSYEAYKADNELNAVFTEVRNILIDANSFTASYDGAGGVVFIDNNVTNDGVTDDPDNTTSTIGTYKSYGPENEVYLAAGQSIAFKVSGGDHYYLGLKAPDSSSTTATVTNGTGTSDLTISSASDLYYEITPTSDGYIMVKNAGSNLLSITKLRSTSDDATASGIALLSADEVEDILVYAASFDSLATVAYTDTGVEEDSFVDTETDTDTEADADTGDTYEDLDEDDIVIDNPTEDTEEETEETVDNSQQSIFSNLFNSIRNWFNGRR